MPTVDVNQIVNWLVELYAPVLVALIVGWIFALLRRLQPSAQAFLNAHTTRQQQQAIRAVVTQAVWAAEQIARREDVQHAANYKLSVARNYAESELARIGLSLPLDHLTAMIEAQVAQDMNMWRKENEAEAANAVVEAAPAHEASKRDNNSLLPVGVWHEA